MPACPKGSGDRELKLALWKLLHLWKVVPFFDLLPKFSFFFSLQQIGTEGGLDLESGRQCLRNLSQELSQRIDLCEEAWTQFSELVDNRHKDKQLWENNMAASNKVKKYLLIYTIPPIELIFILILDLLA